MQFFLVSTLSFSHSYLFTKWSSAGALGLLVAFGQGSVTGA